MKIFWLDLTEGGKKKYLAMKKKRNDIINR